MEILSVYNIKGGVGKTSAAVNLSHLAARQGLRVLLWDLDPQAAATYYFRIKPRISGSTKKLIKGKVDLDDQIKATDYANLDLLPADFSYRKMDVVLGDQKNPTLQLMKLLRPLSYEFDLVVIDCPPSISLVSENIFKASSVLLVPTIPTTLSIRTLEQLEAFFEANQIPRDLLMPFFSMSDRRKSMHVQVMRKLPARHSGFLKNWIPYASDVERMGIHREPVTAFAPASLAGRAYARLWEEVAKKLRLFV
jgi:cellulose biosynthesis protein BcsQ